MRRPEKRTRKNPEAEFQRNVIKHIRKEYPWIRVAHVPNGGGRNKREGAVLKANGVLAGMPDLVLWTDNGRQGWIEIKAPGKGRNPTPSQMERIKDFHACGIPVGVADNLKHVMALLSEWGWLDLEQEK